MQGRERGLSGKSGVGGPRSSVLSLSASAVRARQSVSILRRLGISGVGKGGGRGAVVKFTICLLIRSAIGGGDGGGEIYISITATTTTTVGTEIDERN